MRTNNKQIYESIMKDVSRTISKHLTEDMFDDLHDIEDQKNIDTEFADAVLKTNKFHMEFLADSVLYNFNVDGDKLKPLKNFSDEQLCKVFTVLFNMMAKELKGIADVKVSDIFDFDGIGEDYFSGFLRLEVSNLKEKDFAKFYKIIDKYDGRDDCYYGHFWFEERLDATDNLKFVKWVFDNTEQYNISSNDKKRLTFNDFCKDINYFES